MSHRICLLVAPLLAALTLLPGCGRNNANSGKIKLAFVSNNAHNFWVYAQKGCEKAGKDLDVDVEFRMPNPGTAENQQRIVKELISKGVKGIAVSPNDAVNSVDFFKDQVNKDIPFVCQDNDLPDVSARRCYIGTHNYRAGRAAGELVKKAAPKGGKIAIFVGRMDATNAVERRQGVLDVLMGIDAKEMGKVTDPSAADLKVGDYILVETKTDEGDQAKCQTAASSILTRNPDIVCLIGLWEYNPPALMRAAKGTKATVVGFDENFETLQGIQAGTVVGTVVQNPYRFGALSVEILKGLAEDKGLLKSALKDGEEIDAQNRIFIPHRVIERGNVKGFYAECRKILGKE